MSLPKQVKHKFTFIPELATPQIPFVEDILYMVRLSSKPHYFIMAMRDSPMYITNLGLVIAEAAPDILRIRANKEESLQLSLAKTIIRMCPEDAKCLFVDGYVEAAIRTGQLDVGVKRLSSKERNSACRCVRCNTPFGDLLSR